MGRRAVAKRGEAMAGVLYESPCLVQKPQNLVPPFESAPNTTFPNFWLRFH